MVGKKIFGTIYSIFFVFPFLLTVFVLRVLLSSYLYLFILFVSVVPYNVFVVPYNVFVAPYVYLL